MSTSHAASLDKILTMLESIDRKLDSVIKRLDISRREAPTGVSKAAGPLTDGEILSLQSHLHATAKAIRELKRGTAEQIARITKRGRAIESLYLNELVQLGYAQKEREGRMTYFSLRENLGETKH